MIENHTPGTPELCDHETFHGSICELERNLKKSLWTTWLEIGALLIAIAIPFSPLDRAAAIIIMTGLAASILLSRIYGLHRYEQVKFIIKVQLQATARARKRADKLYGLSILDSLSGLHNRRFGEQRLNEEIARAERTGDALAIILFDLDYFKEINDEFGHAAGDMALREFSRRLRRAIRACDIPVRIGGDEFLVILPDCPTEKLSTILSRIGIPEIDANGQKISVRYSTGRAQYQYSDTRESLIGRADGMLYSAKAGRTRSRDSQKNIAGTSVGEQGAPSIANAQASKLPETDFDLVDNSGSSR